MKLNIEFDAASCEARIKERLAKCQKKLDAQVLKDSNYYCPMFRGILQKSSILSTVIGSGKIVWNTPYAREQYYGKPNKSRDKNPNARMEWFEAAKSKNLRKWEKMVNDEYSGNP